MCLCVFSLLRFLASKEKRDTSFQDNISMYGEREIAGLGLPLNHSTCCLQAGRWYVCKIEK